MTMQSLTADGQKIVADVAARHGVSSDAASGLLSAIAAGGGRQAQFNHPELGGMGQWSQGGMIMIGDMFNNGLKARVAALCSDLAETLKQSDPFETDEPQPWNPASDAKSAKLFMLAAFGHRWPANLGAPAATGSQNDLHYAIFPASRRLAIERNGQVTVYDTGDHRIGGVSQQQAGDQTLRFTDQSGVVRLSDLKIVSDKPEPGDTIPAAAPDTNSTHANGALAPVPASPVIGDTPPPASFLQPGAVSRSAPPASPVAGAASDDEIFSRLERLADLRSRDIITAEEFAAKKAELLARL